MYNCKCTDFAETYILFMSNKLLYVTDMDTLFTFFLIKRRDIYIFDCSNNKINYLIL